VIGVTAGLESSTGPSSLAARFVAAKGLRVLNFEDESVVFNPTSWDAHLLNASAAAVLDLLAQGPRSVADVEVLLTEALLEAEQSDATGHAQRLLHEFEQLGLVRQLKEESIAGG
jgi:PqqD family protein of HPr-rel-A system